MIVHYIHYCSLYPFHLEINKEAKVDAICYLYAEAIIRPIFPFELKFTFWAYGHVIHRQHLIASNTKQMVRERRQTVRVPDFDLSAYALLNAGLFLMYL